jgi:hypothetical protein
MSTLALVLFVIMPLIGLGFALHGVWRYRSSQRVTAKFVQVAKSARKTAEDRPTVEFRYQDRIWRIQLKQAPSKKLLANETGLRLYFPRNRPEKARIWDLSTLWLVLVFAFAPALAAGLLIGDFLLKKPIYDNAFNPGATHYIAANAAWNLDQLYGIAIFALVGLIMIWQAIRRRAEFLNRLGLSLLGTVFLGLSLFLLGLNWQATQQCVAPDSIKRAQRFTGVLEFARQEKTIRARNTGYYELKLQDRVYRSAGFGKASECGFKASLAQSMPLHAGMKVQIATLDGIIIELHVLR